MNARRGERAQSRIHRWAGATICLPLMVHTQSYGYGASAVLVAVFLATVVVGTFNRETLRGRSAQFWSRWMILKVGLSVALLGLLALHVVVGVQFVGSPGGVKTAATP